ncbi:MAG: PorT family protein [Saprospiraceae bacterium]|nr:PorT family protein [Saprospiraceae bacterium]
MNLRFVLFFLIVLFSLNFLNAQNAFRGSAVLGLTLAQIDGDGLLGYDKVGMSTGLKLSYEIRKKLDLNMELLYSQRGSQSGFLGSGDIQKTHLDYLEIPVYVSIKDWYIDGEDYYKIKLHAGLTYGYLMNITSANGLYEEDITKFNTTDISWMIGPSYSINARWTFTARFTRSFTRLFKSDRFINTDSLVSYFWTLRTDYNF